MWGVKIRLRLQIALFARPTRVLAPTGLRRANRRRALYSRRLLTVLGALELALVAAAGFGGEGASYAVSAGNRPEGPAHYPTGYFDSREQICEQIYEWFAGR